VIFKSKIGGKQGVRSNLCHNEPAFKSVLIFSINKC